jgi:hypothetical protein
MKQILELPVIPNVNIKKIHEFYDTLIWVGVKHGNGTERTGGTGMAEPEKRKRKRG